MDVKALITKFRKLNFNYWLLTSFDRIEIGKRHVWVENGYILGRVISFKNCYHFYIGTSCLQYLFSTGTKQVFGEYTRKCTIQNLTLVQQRNHCFLQSFLILVLENSFPLLESSLNDCLYVWDAKFYSKTWSFR